MVIKISDYNLVEQVILQNESRVSLYEKNNKFIIHRYAARGKINNFIDNYELIDKENNSIIKTIDKKYGSAIIQKLKNGENYSNVFIFYEKENDNFSINKEKSASEHKYTSTGIKFWRHQLQMENYKNSKPNTVISTHISPEGACNLKCPYCSVTYRDTHSRIPIDTIKKYINNLKKLGLKAVILTGGGEPTAYKNFNELVRWIKKQDLSVSLITNGSKVYWNKIDEDVCKMFSWVRVSINIFNDWENKIALPLQKFNQNETIIGCSMVYTVEHEMSGEIMNDRVALLKKVSRVADNCGAKYIRLLPNCLLEQKHLIKQHLSLDKVLNQIDDKRFFHQYKLHGAPKSNVCHQAYFRPYLSEEIHKETGKPGTVYPCDSVVLNEGYQHFAEEYQLCHADDILDFFTKKIKQKFNAKERCTGCVFTENVNMLDDYVTKNINKFDQYNKKLTHEEFI